MACDQEPSQISGLPLEEAFLKLQDRYKKLLFDIAEEAKTFEEFKAEVEGFYS